MWVLKIAHFILKKKMYKTILLQDLFNESSESFL